MNSKDIKHYLRYLWFRGVYYRRVVDYIGNLQGSIAFQYLPKELNEQVNTLCASMPAKLKEHRMDEIFRFSIVVPLYNQKLYDIVKRGTDETINRRLAQTMGSFYLTLVAKALISWLQKLIRDALDGLRAIASKLKYHQNGLSLSTLQEALKDISFDGLVVSENYTSFYSNTQQKVRRSLAQGQVKPLTVLFGRRYSLIQDEYGPILTLPLEKKLYLNLTQKDRLLLQELCQWVSGLDIEKSIKRKIICDIKDKFTQYIYYRGLAEQIQQSYHLKYILTLEENTLPYRIFLALANTKAISTINYNPQGMIQPVLYYSYLCEYMFVANKAQYDNYQAIGYSDEKCKVVGSTNFQLNQPLPLNIFDEKSGPLKIIYFSKGTKSIDEGILDEITEKLTQLGCSYELIIKKRPRLDKNTYQRFVNKGAIVSEELDFMDLVEQSHIVVSQYSSIVHTIIPYQKPLIVYTYSELKEFGERAFFTQSTLPNFLKYVQNKEEFHQAIEDLMQLKVLDPIPQKLTEDLYGYFDDRSEERIVQAVEEITKEERQESVLK